MNDKYTIISVNIFWRIYKDFNQEKCEGEIYGDIFIKERAELVCRLLNENEERKNQPRIRTEIKNAILSLIYECIVKSEAGVGEMFIDAIKEIEKWEDPEPIKFKIMSPTEEN